MADFYSFYLARFIAFLYLRGLLRHPVGRGIQKNTGNNLRHCHVQPDIFLMFAFGCLSDINCLENFCTSKSAVFQFLYNHLQSDPKLLTFSVGEFWIRASDSP